MIRTVFAMTGAIGAGKSLAARFFADAGWRTGDADRFCHELYADPASKVTAALAGYFGPDILDHAGAVDRAKLGRLVFDRPAELAKLTGILYPALRAKLDAVIAEARRKGAFLLLEIPLLFEAELALDLDGTIAVWAEESVRHQRLMRDRHYSMAEIRRREAQQLPAVTKLERAEYALINNGRPEFLKQQIQHLITILEEEK